MDATLTSADPLLLENAASEEHTPGAMTVNYHGLNQEIFDRRYGRIPETRFTIKVACDQIRQRCHCSGSCCLSVLQRYVPMVAMFRTYRFKEYILGDIIAGISLAILQVPQSMGYALLASLPPIVGLYTSFFPVLIYFVFGRSRHVSIGTMALTSLILASTIGKALPQFMANNNLDSTQNATNGSNPFGDLNSPVVQEKMKIAMSISFMAGIILTVLSLMKFGILASYISDPFLSGYICGCNIQVLTHQFKHILGITVGSYSGLLSYFYLLWDMCLNLKNTNVATLIISIVAVVILFVVKQFINQRYANKLRVPVPIDIVIVITVTLLSYFCSFEDRFGVKIVKHIPQGLPGPIVPSPKYMSTYMVEAFIIGLVNYVLIFIMVKMFSQKYDYPYDPDQEMLATGLASIFGAFFSSMAGSTSPPRCILGEQAGGKTQLAQLFSAMFVLLTLLFLAPLLEALPLCILACLILVSCIPLFAYYKACVLYWHTSKHDLSVWTVSMVSTMVVGVDMGILIGMSYSVLSVIIRTQAPYSTTLGLFKPDNIFLDSKKYSEKLNTPDALKVFRFEAPLYFATIDLFRQRLFLETHKPSALRSPVEKITNKAASDNEQMNGKSNMEDGSTEMIDSVPDCSHVDNKIEAVIIDCASIPFVDTSGAIALGKLNKEYKTASIQFVLANVCETVRHTIGNVKECQALTLYPTVYDAIVDLDILKNGVKTNGQEHSS